MFRCDCNGVSSARAGGDGGGGRRRRGGGAAAVHARVRRTEPRARLRVLPLVPEVSYCLLAFFFIFDFCKKKKCQNTCLAKKDRAF